MPFSGGGSGPSTPLNHNHTNLAGEGGALDSNTLLNATPLIDQFPETMILQGVSPTNQVNVGANNQTIYGLSGSEAASEAAVCKAATWRLLTTSVQSNSHSNSGNVFTRINSTDGNQNITIPAGLSGDFQDNVNTDALVYGTEINVKHYWSAGAGTVVFDKGSSMFT